MENDINLLPPENEYKDKDVSATPKEGVKGHFFTVSLNAIQRMARQGALAEDIMSYLVLARHTPGRGEWQRVLSTSGAKAIHLRTGIPYRRAVCSLEWLENAGFIIPINSATKQDMPDLPEHLGKIKTRATTVRWFLKDFHEPLIYLANTLIDGTRGAGEKNPPLMRLMDGISINTFKKSETRLDALMLLLHLYYHHELEEFGGVNPKSALYREWDHTTEVLESPYSSLQLFAIIQANAFAQNQFINEAFSYVNNETKVNRLWNALDNLKALGFLYEVIQIWEGNPFVTRTAEMLYPLYILDRHARQSEPYLAKAIHTTLIKGDAITPFNIPKFFQKMNKGEFRYLAHTPLFPLGIFRLRFRPHIQDTGRWLQAEMNKVGVWQQLLNKLKP